jgi:hypothetical protein
LVLASSMRKIHVLESRHGNLVKMLAKFIRRGVDFQ